MTQIQYIVTQYSDPNSQLFYNFINSYQYILISMEIANKNEKKKNEKTKEKRMELPFAILKIFDVSMGMREF